MKAINIQALPFELRDRIQQRAREWRLGIDESFETETSVIAFATRGNQRLVLKVIKHECDEWNSGAVVSAFEGRGMARVFEHTAGALLLERLQPGTSLVDLAINQRDEEATEILVGVTERMRAREVPDGIPSISAWGEGFSRYLVSGGEHIPKDLVESARQAFADLEETQRRPLLLHGDLQHYNVLFDSARGWLAIDPKGIVGELEYEIGAMLRNPFAQPDLFLSPSTIQRRLRQFESRLNLNYERMLTWAFAQAVLSAIWSWEDGFKVDSPNPSLRLAEVLRVMVGK